MRFANQVYLHQKVLDIQRRETLLNFIDVLAADLQFSSTNSFIANIFFSNKSQLSNKSLQRLINLVDNESDQFNNNKLTIPIHEKKQSQLIQLPKELFESIGSYLDINSSLKFSSCSRKCHRNVLNRAYFASHPCTKCLTLTDKQLRKIAQSKSILDFYIPNCYRLRIVKDEADASGSCNISYSCNCVDTTCNMIVDCGLKDFFGDHDMTKPDVKINCNYDKEWMNILLSTIASLRVDNSWVCAFRHLPFDKLFTMTEYSEYYDISVCGVNNTMIKQKNMTIFSTKYDQFYRHYQQEIEKQETESQAQACMSDTSEFEMTLRKLQIRYDYCSTNLFTCLEKLHSNYNSISFSIPPLKSQQFINAKHFTKIFHNEELFSEMYFRDWDDSKTIAASIFQNRILIDDLNKGDDKLSFDGLLIKQGIDKNELPDIYTLAIHFKSLSKAQYNTFNTFKKFFENEKLVQLFNLSRTVKSIRMYQSRALTGEYIEKCLQTITLSKTHLYNVQRITIMVNKTKYWSEENANLLADIISNSLQHFPKLQSFRMNKGSSLPELKYEIGINDADEVTDKNKFESILKPKIAAACVRCVQTKCKNRANDVFKFERHYKV